jgi:putative membrane protein
MSADTRLPARHGSVLLMAGWLSLLWLVTAIEPFSRRDWLLENLLVFFYCGLLVVTWHRFRFSTLSYLLFTAFMSLHLIGAHYTYSEVPFGFWLRDALDLTRNHYDRIVHFAFGLLIAYPFREWMLRVTGIRPGWSGFMTVVMVLAFSGSYEVIEGVVAMIVSPELGMEYLGTQGDQWDAQHDTLLAFGGAVIAMLVVAILNRRSAEPVRLPPLP